MQLLSNESLSRINLSANAYFWQIYFTIWTWSANRASISGVIPQVSLEASIFSARSTDSFKSRINTSKWPWSEAVWNGVRPFLVREFKLNCTFNLSKYLIISKSPSLKNIYIRISRFQLKVNENRNKLNWPDRDLKCIPSIFVDSCDVCFVLNKILNDLKIFSCAGQHQRCPISFS